MSKPSSYRRRYAKKSIDKAYRLFVEGKGSMRDLAREGEVRAKNEKQGLYPLSKRWPVDPKPKSNLL